MKRFLLAVLFCSVALFGPNETLAFIGPSASPPSGVGELLVASSTRALGITTSTVYFTPSSLTIKPNGASTPSIFFDSDGDIGIATTTPGQKLVVAGSAQASGFIGSAASLTSLDPANLTAGAFTASNFAFPSALAVGTSTTTGLPGNGLLVIGTTTLATKSGSSVGIGTTNPQRVLHIQSSDATLRIDRDYDTTALMLVRTAQGDFSTVWKSFMFGTNASGVNNGYFFVSDLGTTVSGGGTNRFTISNNGYVGVGTTTPQAKLHVEGEEIRLMNANGSNPTRYIYIDRGANGINAVNQTLHLNRAETTDITLVAGGGNVAVGTTTPAYKLDVYGTARFTQPIIVGEPTASTHATTKSYVDSVSTGASGVWLQTGSYLYTSSTSWNVGVGIATPTYKIHAKGTGAIIGVESDTADDSVRFRLDTGATSSAQANTIIDFQNSGVTQWQVISRQSAAIDRFEINESGSTARFVISSGGNVGIGTGTPGKMLEVAGSASPGGTLRFSNLDTTVDPGESFGEIDFYAVDASTNGTGISGFIKNVAVNAGVSSALTLGTRPASGSANAIERVRINEDGYVGISTTTPVYTLDVVGTARFTQPVVVGTPTASTHATTKSYVDSVSTGASGVWLQTGSYLYTSSTSWNVGVGIQTPLHQLQVSRAASTTTRTAHFDMTGGTSGTEYTVAQFDVGGSGAQSPAIAISSNATIGLKLTHTNNFARAFIDHNYSSATALAFGLRGTEHMRIDNNGYVGIGITTPSSLLHIAEGGFLTFQAPNTVAGGINFYETGTISSSSVQYGATVRYDPYADRLEILTRQDGVDENGIVIARATGNVGIGGTTTTYKLDVTGTGRFTQPIVVGTPTASTHATTKSYVDSVLSGSTGVWLQSGSNLYASSTSWNVAIGTTDAGSYKLNVAGAAYSSAGWEGPTSDIRLKKNVATLSNVLGKLENVRGVSFDWRFDEFPEHNFPDERQIGVIAQELEKAFPELVTTDPHGYKLVRYTQLSAVLLQAIKEQQLEIKDLEARIKKLEVRNTDTEE